VLSTGHFHGYRICRLLDVEDEGVTYTIQYSSKSLDEYNKYKADHAPRMQHEVFKKFGEKFVAFRTLMEVIE
jgi:hypothetical protein